MSSSLREELERIDQEYIANVREYLTPEELGRAETRLDSERRDLLRRMEPDTRLDAREYRLESRDPRTAHADSSDPDDERAEMIRRNRAMAQGGES